MGDRIAARSFGAEDQERFARFSGDANPMHLDALAARRTLAGAPVVHWIHTVLWALETLVDRGLIADSGRIEPATVDLDVKFKKFLYVGDEAQLVIDERTASSARCSVNARGVAVTTIAVKWPAVSSSAAFERVSGEPQPIPPVARDLSLETVAGDSGCLALDSATDVDALFPAAAQFFGKQTVVALAQLSALVGMVCPGLHSVFGGLRIAVGRARANAGLAYRVESVAPRFRRVEIAVDGPGVAGAITTFMRSAPVPQPALRDVRAYVEPGEFAATTALVIGGSRGLGALTARILAAGGARVVVTYNVGVREARELADEVGESCARIMRYDALDDADAQLADLPWEINQLYYFATAQIFRSGEGLYSAARFSEFSAIYVDGFARLCAALCARSREPLAIFYPSSVAVVERPREMTEYAMAKAAGEILCADLAAFTRGVRVVTARLPRLATDQTATLLPSRTADPIAELLPYVRAMHGPEWRAHPSTGSG